MEETVRLSRGMMARWEIPDRRAARMENVIFGSDADMLAVSRLSDGGSLCVTARAEALNAQDGMFTVLIRGEEKSEEYVAQNILAAVNPESDFDNFLKFAQNADFRRLILRADAPDVQKALAVRFLYERFARNVPPAEVLLIANLLSEDGATDFAAFAERVSADWANTAEYGAYLRSMKIGQAYLDCMCGFMNAREAAMQARRMNYADEFVMWSEPSARLGSGADAEKRARILLTAATMCAAGGWFCGCGSFAAAMRDEELRRWIGRAFAEEVLPNLPWNREEIAQDVISAFGRLENPANEAPLTETFAGRYLLGNLRETLLPTVRAYAAKEFDAPPMLTLAISALVMLYAGTRIEKDGAAWVQRGEERCRLTDQTEIITEFSKFAHDMPAESLAYAALADRSVWGEDLREIDGLEARVAAALSSIQRIGFRQTLKNRIAEG